MLASLGAEPRLHAGLLCSTRFGALAMCIAFGPNEAIGSHTEWNELFDAMRCSRLIDNANAPIFGINKDGLVNEWNKKAAEITGFPKEEVWHAG